MDDLFLVGCYVVSIGNSWRRFEGAFCLRGLIDPEDEDTAILRMVDNSFQINMSPQRN